MQFSINRRRRVRWVCAVVGVLLFASTACADTEQPHVVLGPWMTNTEIGPGADLSGKQLAGCVFVGQDFRGAVFDDCDFFGCRICQCDFRGASFKRANFSGLRLGDSDFEGADFTDAIINGIKAWDLRHRKGCRLTVEQFTSTLSYRTKNLENCYIHIVSKAGDEPAKPRFDFRKADLREATFMHCDLTRSDFSDARIANLSVKYSIISEEQLASTWDFKKRTLLGVRRLSLSPTSRLDFSGFRLQGVTIVNSLRPSNDLRGLRLFADCEFIGGTARGTLEQFVNFAVGDLTGTRFDTVDFSGVNLATQNLTRCSFRDCIFEDTNFEDAIISGARFSVFRSKDVHLTLAQIRSTWNYKHGRMAGIRLPEELAKALEKEAQENEEEPAAGESGGEKTEGNE